MSHTPTVTVAKNAGFCFGVARATKAVETEMADHPAGSASSPWAASSTTRSTINAWPREG